MLYEAMSLVDPTTGQPRGFLRLSANTRPDSVLFTLDIRPDGSWREAEHFIKATAPELVQVGGCGSKHGVCCLWLSGDQLVTQLCPRFVVSLQASNINMRADSAGHQARWQLA